MKFGQLLCSSALALIIATPVTGFADTSELATPIVKLMPHFKNLRSQLNLNETQNATIDAWVAEAPAKRKELETEITAIRLELREAILNGETRIKREKLKKALATQQTRLIEMRSLCTRMLRDALTEDQFSKVVKSYRAG